VLLRSFHLRELLVHPAKLEIDKLVAQCDFTRTRRGGPGGQHRNKVESAVVVQHRPTGVIAEANERRSQADNRRSAIFRLRVNLALAVRSFENPDETELNEIDLDEAQSNETATTKQSPRAHDEGNAAVPSEAWSKRLAGTKIVLNPQSQDFPSILAELLDVAAVAGWDLKKAAEQLETTSSQLLKILKFDSRGLDLVNQRRRQKKMRPLR